ncbi:MAG: hypothetical protein EYC69_04585 [Bacteroidetes bacterium]|nr:MAG: hypothetical protein EYC69_04585 [Bacteroidota bacterium]
MAKRKTKAGSSAKTTGTKKRGPGRPPGTGTGTYKKKTKRGPGRPPGTGTGTYKKKTKRGPGRPPGTGTGTYKKAKRGPGRPPGTGTGTYKKAKRGPGRPPGTGTGTYNKSKRGPGRPPKAQSLEGVRITDRDLGKLLDLQSMILDVQRAHFKRSGKFDLSLTKQFSENFKTVDRIVEILSKKA